EAGTPNMAGVIGLGAALDYFTALDFESMEAYEQNLLAYATTGILSLKGFRIVGTAADKVPVLSLLHEHIHAHDIGTILDAEGIAIRSGHHCAMPIMDFFGVAATARVSLSFYNTKEEVDRVILALSHVNAIFS
ncbi:MAG: aminotransferase class V-fold PLP-dependent enzyme, partial [Legionellaceae bacterium]